MTDGIGADGTDLEFHSEFLNTGFDDELSRRIAEIEAAKAADYKRVPAGVKVRNPKTGKVEHGGQPMPRRQTPESMQETYGRMRPEKMGRVQGRLGENIALDYFKSKGWTAERANGDNIFLGVDVLAHTDHKVYVGEVKASAPDKKDKRFRVNVGGAAYAAAKAEVPESEWPTLFAKMEAATLERKQVLLAKIGKESGMEAVPVTLTVIPNYKTGKATVAMHNGFLSNITFAQHYKIAEETPITEEEMRDARQSVMKADASQSAMQIFTQGLDQDVARMMETLKRLMGHLQGASKSIWANEWDRVLARWAEKAGYRRVPKGTKFFNSRTGKVEHGGQPIPISPAEQQAMDRAAGIRPGSRRAKDAVKSTFETIEWLQDNIGEIYRLHTQPARSATEDDRYQNLRLEAEERMEDAIPVVLKTMNSMKQKLVGRLGDPKFMAVTPPEDLAYVKRALGSTEHRVHELENWGNGNFVQHVTWFDNAVNQIHQDTSFWYHVQETMDTFGDDEVNDIAHRLLKRRGQNKRIFHEFGRMASKAAS